MAHLKVYEWERERWPLFQRVLINRWQQEQVLAHLANQFGVVCPAIGQSYQSGVARGEGGGQYVPATQVVQLGVKTSLGTVVHEFAHHLNHLLNPEDAAKRHHGRTFKKCLRACYSKARKFTRMWA